MTLGDLNPDFEVTAFFEVEYLGPDWSYVRYRTRYSPSTRPIWSISDKRVVWLCQYQLASCMFYCRPSGTVTSVAQACIVTACTVRMLPIPIDSDSTVKEPHDM